MFHKLRVKVFVCGKHQKDLLWHLGHLYWAIQLFAREDCAKVRQQIVSRKEAPTAGGRGGVKELGRGIHLLMYPAT